jgi:hypothetical protein
VNIGLLISTEKRYEESIPVLTEALEGYREWSGPAATHTLAVTGFLVRELANSGDREGAEAQINRAIKLIELDPNLPEDAQKSAVDRVLQISERYL